MLSTNTFIHCTTLPIQSMSLLRYIKFFLATSLPLSYKKSTNFLYVTLWQKRWIKEELHALTTTQHNDFIKDFYFDTLYKFLRYGRRGGAPSEGWPRQGAITCSCWCAARTASGLGPTHGPGEGIGTATRHKITLKRVFLRIVHITRDHSSIR